MVVLLHGNGGAFSFYAGVSVPGLVRAGWAVALPSLGFGNWASDAGEARVRELLTALAQESRVDPRRVLLGGVSAGGMGAIAAVASGAVSDVLGVFAVSGVPLECNFLAASGFLRQARAVGHADPCPHSFPTD